MNDTLPAPSKPARKPLVAKPRGRSARREIIITVGDVTEKYNFALTVTGDLIVRRYRHKTTVTLHAHELIKLSKNLQEGSLGL